jgi:hypothetical protein
MGLLGQATSETLTSETAPEVVTSVATAPAQEIDVAVLQAQLETIREYNDRLLSTVHWSLGTVAGVAVLLVGFSWFTNNRSYERDKEALNKELTGVIKSEISDQTHELRGEIFELMKSTAQREVALVTIDMENLRQEFKHWESDFLDLRYDSAKLNALYWELRGNPGAALTQYIRMLKMTTHLESDHYVNTALRGITESLKKEAGILSYEVPAINERLDALPNKFSTDIGIIKELLKTSPRI